MKTLLDIIKTNINQSPLAAYTDYPFRKIIRKYGCRGLIFTEMISGRGYQMNSDFHDRFIKFEDVDRPVGVQLFGSDPEALALTAKDIENKFKPDLIDINMGCPARKVTGKSGGAALLKHPDLAEKIILSVLKKIKTPLSIKTRIGWSINDCKSKDLIKIAEENGLLCVFLHLRSKKALFSGELELENFKTLKAVFKIPIIANGGFYSKEDYDRIVNDINPEGILIGRGSTGNPWIFDINKSDYKEPTREKRISVMIEHFNLMIDEYGETSGILKFRKFLKPYLKGIPDHVKFLPQLIRFKTKQEIIETIRKHFQATKLLD